MKISILENGDKQVADYQYRIRKDYTTVVYYLTEQCNFKCKYCTGWNAGVKDCLTDRHSVGEIVDSFIHLQEDSGQKIYIWLTGGEPSVVTNFPILMQQLTKYIDIELQTNLCTRSIKEFARLANPSHVGEVMATYHDDILKENNSLKQLYFDNFKMLTESGYNVVLKIIAPPGQLSNFKDKLCLLKEKLPIDSPILIQPFLSGKELSPKEHCSSYPYAYTQEDRRYLNDIVEIRRGEIFDYINGAGWFEGMICDAGRGFIAINKRGDAYKCVRDMIHKTHLMGNLVKNNIVLHNRSQVCRTPYCYAPFWGLWYGVKPWKYIGDKSGDGRYNRFSSDVVSSNISSNRMLKCRSKRHISATAIIRNILDWWRERIYCSNMYLRWAGIAKDNDDYAAANKYIVYAFKHNAVNLRALILKFAVWWALRKR